MSQSETLEGWLAVLNECDSLIKSGKLPLAVEKVRGVALAKVPRSQRHPLAKICRRVGLIDEGLRLLYSTVRDPSPSEGPASPSEVCEYAVLLSRNGSTEEALALLETIDPLLVSDVRLYRALCEIALWNYSSAIQLLRDYLRTPPDAYAALIASVNLGAAYLATDQLEPAEPLLTKTIELAEKQGASRIAGNCLEQRGQYYIRMGSLEKAQEDLSRASKILGESGSYDQLLIQKWQSIIQSIEQKSAQPLRKLKESAMESRHWETVREADLFSLLVDWKPDLFDHLYFGTPMPGYRKWIRQRIAHHPSSQFILGDPASETSIALRRGILQKGSVSVRIPKSVHSVFEALIKDFYIPRNIGSLFYLLYPQEYFNIESSPLKVRQALHRSRKWISEQGLPVEIAFEQGDYKLNINGSIGIRIELPSGDGVGQAHQPAKWQELVAAFKDRDAFSTLEVSESLRISRPAAQRLLKWGLDNGELARLGLGSASSYIFQGSD